MDATPTDPTYLDMVDDMARRIAAWDGNGDLAEFARLVSILASAAPKLTAEVRRLRREPERD
jgi:hypothetical protein